MQFVMYTGKLQSTISTFIFYYVTFTYDIYYLNTHFYITILQNIMCKCAKSFSFFVPKPPAGAVPLDPTGGLPSPEPHD